MLIKLARSYLDPGNIQIALYDDRLEITSPGMLLQGITIEKMKEGYSKIRNRAIASAFTYMKYIEEWGSGIPRILAQFRKRGLKQPELMDFDGDFRVNFYRQSYIEEQLVSYNQAVINNNQKRTKKGPKKEVDQLMIELIQENSKISQRELSEELGLSKTTILRKQKELIEKGLVKRIGKGKNCYLIADIQENDK